MNFIFYFKVKTFFIFLNSFVCSQGRVQSSENLYLEEGHWFVSLYNDDGEPQPVEILLADSQGAGKLASTADAIDSIRI